MAPAMKWMAKKTTESEEKPAKGKGKSKKETNKGSSESRGKEKGSHQSWSWNDWEYDSWGWNDWGNSKPKSKKGKGEEEKGSKGKSKGKHEDRDDEKKGKGKGKGKSEKGDWPPVNGAKTVAEVEAEMSKGKIERVKRNPDSGGKQPVEATGSHCQVHKHSGMGCAVVSLSTAETREAIMCYAEKTFGRSAAGKLEMDIADVKVQLKRHKDKGSGREVVTDIFVAWGHQQEKDSPLTVDEIAQFFDQLYEDTMNAPPGSIGPAPVPAGAPAAMMAGRGALRPPPPPMHMGHPPMPQPNPYYNAMYGAMMNPAMHGAMNPYMQQQLAAQQAQAAAYAAYHQQMQQQQYMHMYEASKGKWGGKGMKGAGKGKEQKGGDDAAAAAATAAAAAPAPAPAEGEEKADATAEGAEVAVPGVPEFSPPKPRLLQIVDPTSGKPIDTISMNFAPRKPSTPLQIKNPTTGEAVDVEGAKS